jgi:hypothetical protein
MPDTPKLPELPQHVLDSMIPLDTNRPEPTFPKFASVALTQIEKYAIELLHQGGEHMAEDDLDEGEVFAIEQEQDWRSACDLSIEMAHAVRDHPEEFLAWFREATR